MPHDYRLGQEKLRVFVLFGGGASSGVGLATGAKQTYEVVGAGTNKPDAPGIQKLRDAGVEVVPPLDYDTFCETNGYEGWKRDTNHRYHDKWLEEIAPFNPHVIALSGYFKIVPDIFLKEYPMIMNVHPAYLHYLTRKRDKGDTRPEYDMLLDVGDMNPSQVAILMERNGLKRAFTGEAAVYDALVFGYEHGIAEVGSTIHIATEQVDAGPILVESAPLPIDREKTGILIRTKSWNRLMAYREELQGRLKGEGDIPAFRAAIELFAGGRLTVKDGAYLDGERLPYKGHQLEKVRETHATDV